MQHCWCPSRHGFSHPIPQVHASLSFHDKMGHTVCKFPKQAWEAADPDPVCWQDKRAQGKGLLHLYGRPGCPGSGVGSMLHLPPPACLQGWFDDEVEARHALKMLPTLEQVRLDRREIHWVPGSREGRWWEGDGGGEVDESWVF